MNSSSQHPFPQRVVQLIATSIVVLLLIMMQPQRFVLANDDLPLPPSPLLDNNRGDTTTALLSITLNQEQQTITPIVLSSSGQIVSGSVKYGSFDMYSITIPSWSCLTLSFRLPSYSSSVSVYVKEGGMPTDYSYDYSIISQYSSKDIYPFSLNSTSTFYIAVYADYSTNNFNNYVLTAVVSSYVPNWMIGVIVGSVIAGILVLIVLFIVPVLICLGLCGCLCATAAANTTNSSTVTTPESRNSIRTYTNVHTPIMTPQSPFYYSQHHDTAYYNPNVEQPLNNPHHYQSQYTTYQKIH